CVSFKFCESQHNPNFLENRHVIVHLFEWKFSDIANECEQYLGPKGYGGIQLSPVNENLIKKEIYGRPWWERYQPISYLIQTRSGNEEDFLNMSKRCNDAGVRIYVDVVFNHMAAGHGKPTEEMLGTAGSKANATIRDYPGVPYVNEEFHSECIISDYTDGNDVRNCQLGTLPDLNQSIESVRMKIVNFLNHLIDLGAAGFRIDAAKHMWPMDVKAILENVKNLNIEFNFPPNSRPFFYQEVIDLGGEAVSKTEYNSFGVVTEFLYSKEIGEIFNGKKSLSTLINWGPTIGFLPHSDALVFIDNHDNQRGHGAGGELILTHKKPKKYIMATAFMLSHPYGIKRIMSSYQFNSTDQGPPADENDNILSPIFDNKTEECLAYDKENNVSWICEHRWQSIVNMVEFLKIVEGQPISNWQDNGPNQIAFCRGNKGFIAFNNDPFLDYKTKVVACLKPGEYCDIISGKIIDENRNDQNTNGENILNENNTTSPNNQNNNSNNNNKEINENKKCSGEKLIIDADGYANINIPFNGKHGVIAIHENSNIKEL
ncbi:alpha-amylase 1-like, partial [Condylostylus longicornis]|uniref:alpha-amylase 1-like n=1 Tax=Condylostylus longicornis TaxID=2530218 RepID=UPI00244E0F19